MISEQEMVDVLRSACDAVGGQREWSRRNSVSYKWTNNVITGQAKMSAGMSVRLGCRRVVRFEEIER